MQNFQAIKDALQFIDEHLGEDISLEQLANRFYFSQYYFHRMFSLIVGKSLAAYVRDRRLLKACTELGSTKKSVLDIAVDCGFNSAQAFSRAFKTANGMSPKQYRASNLMPVVTSVDELIMKFTNRIKGGILIMPSIIKKDALIIAGTSGDGNQTAEVWQAFEELCKISPLKNALSNNGYEIRLYEDGESTVHVGYAVSGENVEPPYAVFKLPASQYASFDVYVSQGYMSENDAMQEWFAGNSGVYTERFLGNAHYCLEYYDERFNGEEAGSIVEIWVPIEKV